MTDQEKDSEKEKEEEIQKDEESSSETQITVRRFDPEALLSDDVANRDAD